MTKLLVAAVGFVVGGAIITGIALALPGSAQPSKAPAVAQNAMVAMTSASTPTTKKLTIQHVLKGCHVWSDGSRRAVTMDLTLKRGTRLTIADMDVDPHRLVQLAGPRLGLHSHMMMGGVESVVFEQTGLYRLTTQTVEMGPLMETKTIGPDNKLRLTVRVA